MTLSLSVNECVCAWCTLIDWVNVQLTFRIGFRSTMTLSRLKQVRKIKGTKKGKWPLWPVTKFLEGMCVVFLEFIHFFLWIACPHTWKWVCLSINPSIHLSIHPPIYLSIYLSNKRNAYHAMFHEVLHEGTRVQNQRLLQLFLLQIAVWRTYKHIDVHHTCM